MKKKILIVEDEEIIRRLCGRFLAKLGHELIMVDRIQEALKKIQSTEFDLLVTDLRLPDGNGVDVVSEFKRKFPNRHIIIMTGSPSPEERLQNIDAMDAVELIYKPFEPAVLEAAIRKGLGEKPS